jgi:hypothetical protein
MEGVVMPRIIIATTFRDFRGNENDKIQYAFLDSIRKQSVTDYELCVTIFNEKNVEIVLDKCDLPCSFYHSDPGVFRYSLSMVFSNAIERVKQTSADILLWTTCDIEFPRNFFKVLLRDKNRFDVFTSHPHFSNGELSLISIGGFDCLAFKKELVLKKYFKEAILEYQNFDWGVFEHFLIALSDRGNAKFGNYFGYLNILKHENNRVVTAETALFLNKSWHNNAVTFAKYLKEHGGSDRYFSLDYCHELFRPARYILYHFRIKGAKPKKTMLSHFKRFKRIMRKILIRLLKLP